MTRSARLHLLTDARADPSSRGCSLLQQRPRWVFFATVLMLHCKYCLKIHEPQRLSTGLSLLLLCTLHSQRLWTTLLPRCARSCNACRYGSSRSVWWPRRCTLSSS
jgi:hypothetical protein